MEGKYITVTIDPTGQRVDVEMDGFHGDGCKAMMEVFDSMGEVIHEEYKPEAYESRNLHVLRTSA